MPSKSSPSASPSSTPRRAGAYFGVGVLLLTGAAAWLGSGARQRAGVRMAVQPTRLAQARDRDGDGVPYALGMESKPPAKVNEAGADWDEAEQTFDTVYGLVKQYYVDKLPSDHAMTHGAIRSLLASLNDPNCYFLDKTQMQLLTDEGQGRFAGIGAALSVRAQKKDGYTEHKIVVVSALPGSPAAGAGLLPGDVITHVGGKWVLGFDPYLRANRLAQQVQARGDAAEENDAVIKEVRSAQRKANGGIALLDAMQVLRGDKTVLPKVKLPSDEVTLTVARAGVATPLKLTLMPSVTDVNQTAPVAARVLDGDGAAYVRVPVFTQKSAEDFRRALDSLPVTSRDRGIVLDLRGNPGGDLQAALDLGASLAPGTMGTQVMTGGRTKALRSEKAGSAQTVPRRPVALLVDKGTANVAEALAAALVDKGVGTLVGGRTFGDASLQTAFELPDGSAFVLVTGRMQGPRTRWAGAGLAPSVAVANLTEELLLRRAAEALRAAPRIAARP